jgi:hypothetical protein
MPTGGMLGLLRAVALVAAMAGAVGSEALMLRAGQRSPRLLIVLFTIWVLSPFVALGWANVVSKRWSALTQATLYGVTLVVTVCSLAIYGRPVLVAPARSPNAFVFVVVSPASWLLMAIVVPVAAFVSGRRSRRGAGA